MRSRPARSRVRVISVVSVLCLLCAVAPWVGRGGNKDLSATPNAVAGGGERREGKSSPAVALQPIPSANAPPALLDRGLSATSGLDCLIEPHQTVELATTVSGIVKEIQVDRGQIVESGQILARLEAEVEKANVAYALARTEFSSKKYNRMLELFKEQMISAQQLEEAKAENDTTQAELQRATELLIQRTIVSTFSGVVVERYVSPGELVENKKIVKLAQIHPLNVEIIVPVSMLGGFTMGSKVLVFPEGPVSGPLEARVDLVDRVIDAASGTFRVRLDLPNPRYKIAAGVRCKARLAVAP